jgi:hypothetical protein
VFWCRVLLYFCVHASILGLFLCSGSNFDFLVFCGRICEYFRILGSSLGSFFCVQWSSLGFILCSGVEFDNFWCQVLVSSLCVIFLCSGIEFGNFWIVLVLWGRVWCSCVSLVFFVFWGLLYMPSIHWTNFIYCIVSGIR